MHLDCLLFVECSRNSSDALFAAYFCVHFKMMPRPLWGIFEACLWVHFEMMQRQLWGNLEAILRHVLESILRCCGDDAEISRTAQKWKASSKAKKDFSRNAQRCLALRFEASFSVSRTHLQPFSNSYLNWSGKAFQILRTVRNFEPPVSDRYTRTSL